MSLKIFVATTQILGITLPKNYQAIFLGNAKTDVPQDYIRELKGDTIVEKNPFFCELTGMYYVWKNCDLPDYIGFCHYRRYLNIADHPDVNQWTKCAATDKVPTLLRDADFILPKATTYDNDYTVEKQYDVYHRKEDFDTVREVIAERCPKYLAAFDEVAASDTAYLNNIFVTTREHFARYMEWLFDILLHAEKLIAVPYDEPYQRRLFGFLAERLLNVYLRHNKLRVVERQLLKLEFGGNKPDYSRTVSLRNRKIYTLSLFAAMNGRRIVFCGDEKSHERLRSLVQDACAFRRITDDAGKINIPNLTRYMLNNPNVAFIFLLKNFEELSERITSYGLRINVDYYDGEFLL